jgi:hypothetical protein
MQDRYGALYFLTHLRPAEGHKCVVRLHITVKWSEVPIFKRIHRLSRPSEIHISWFRSNN